LVVVVEVVLHLQLVLVLRVLLRVVEDVEQQVVELFLDRVFNVEQPILVVVEVVRGLD
tara:strand:+ start:290 stop:463 length:174 start_codon:yes stop_codon:yes gene_type:complete